MSKEIDDFRTACISRALDHRQIAMQKQNRVFFQVSGAGNEVLGVSLARSLEPGRDWFFPYYREQALVLGLGATPHDLLLQAVGSADDPASAGRQMPAHWGDPDRHIVTASSPTGSQCLPAVGCAEASRYLGRDEITYVGLGEGTTSQGEFWEAINTATVLRLPVLFVIADNGWAISVPTSQQQPAPISQLVTGFTGLEVAHVDGTDYPATRRAVTDLVDHLRQGGGPALLHAEVTRPLSHSGADTQTLYRTAQDLAAEAERDPLDRMETMLIDRGLLTADETAAIRDEARTIVLEAAESALSARRPDPATVTHHLVDHPNIAPTDPPEGGERLGMGDAINRCLHEVMERDETIRVFGEDVADAPDDVLDDVPGKGGVFGLTKGLQRRFGSDRCFNTPLAEAAIVGRAVGQAIRGLRPSPEIQFFDYIWPAMTQIRSEAATTRWRSAGRFDVPMVLRVPIGGYLTGGAIWHSQSGESIFTHIPGLTVVMPSRTRDAVGLLRMAFRSNDPVLFLEHKHLFRQPYAADPYPDDWILPFGHADVRRPGDDLTIVTWGATVEKSLQAAQQVSADGIETEVIDLRSLLPWDHDTVAASVAHTGRLLVVHEDTITSGFGAEIASWMGEHHFTDLDAPIRRIGALDTPVGYEPTLEDAILPQVDDIEAAIRDLADY